MRKSLASQKMQSFHPRMLLSSAVFLLAHDPPLAELGLFPGTSCVRFVAGVEQGERKFWNPFAGLFGGGEKKDPAEHDDDGDDNELEQEDTEKAAPSVWESFKGLLGLSGGTDDAAKKEEERQQARLAAQEAVKQKAAQAKAAAAAKAEEQAQEAQIKAKEDEEQQAAEKRRLLAEAAAAEARRKAEQQRKDPETAAKNAAKAKAKAGAAHGAVESAQKVEGAQGSPPMSPSKLSRARSSMLSPDLHLNALMENAAGKPSAITPVPPAGGGGGGALSSASSPQKPVISSSSSPSPSLQSKPVAATSAASSPPELSRVNSAPGPKPRSTPPASPKKESTPAASAPGASPTGGVAAQAELRRVQSAITPTPSKRPPPPASPAAASVKMNLGAAFEEAAAAEKKGSPSEASTRTPSEASTFHASAPSSTGQKAGTVRRKFSFADELPQKAVELPQNGNVAPLTEKNLAAAKLTKDGLASCLFNQIVFFLAPRHQEQPLLGRDPPSHTVGLLLLDVEQAQAVWLSQVVGSRRPEEFHSGC
ncbi:unnamed protein product [Amoebophrya sp. A120]|nr:unnamed protein product [Amoebophrya sp. A120]|eukprot:GSA120T00022162001.1